MGSQLRYGFRNRLKCHLLQSNRHGFRNVLSSKWTGVSLKGYRQNGHETGPGGEKANQLFNTTCNKWHFNRFLEHVQQSIIQLYLQKVTL
jgi:hypothetical protein